MTIRVVNECRNDSQTWLYIFEIHFKFSDFRCQMFKVPAIGLYEITQ